MLRTKWFNYLRTNNKQSKIITHKYVILIVIYYKLSCHQVLQNVFRNLHCKSVQQWMKMDVTAQKENVLARNMVGKSTNILGI